MQPPILRKLRRDMALARKDLPHVPHNCAPGWDHGLHRWLHAPGASGVLGWTGQRMCAFFTDLAPRAKFVI